MRRIDGAFNGLSRRKQDRGERSQIKSIQIKSKWYLKSYTEQNGRYHHAAITAKDIAAQKG